MQWEVKEVGGDPSANSKLRDVIAKAKANNMPNDNIDRCIKKALGDGDRNSYEEIFYEGYGPCGVAVMVEALTDNRNRTAGDVRHYFDKFGGNLGQNGCVSYLFAPRGVIIIDLPGLNEDKLMEDCIEAGAMDFSFEDGVAEIFTAPEELSRVREALEAAGYTFASAQVEYIPSTYATIDTPELAAKMTRLLEMLEDNDDVQNVWHNWEE